MSSTNCDGEYGVQKDRDSETAFFFGVFGVMFQGAVGGRGSGGDTISPEETATRWMVSLIH